MEYIIYDVETTGLGPKDEICQFAGFLVDENCKLKRLYAFYCNPLANISPSALAVHHLSKEVLLKLSDGKFFEEQFLSLSNLTDKKDITWCSYNIAFDKRMINQSLMLAGYNTYNFGIKVPNLTKDHGVYHFDIMDAVANYYNRGKRVKLEYAIRNYCNIAYGDIEDNYKKIMSFCGMDNMAQFHDAIFDSYAAYCLFAQLFDFLKV